ncbi:DUF6455 family protein [Gemmobacter denitrificans]|uniref:DUF6455 family protein n=1 Tax=Gemmobacter denitrificans TaxID=3123040 RepID=A0ABU8BVD8_9RHOB
MRERLQTLFAKWRSLTEIEALTERDLTDIGLNRAQIEDFVRMPADTTARMARMAAIFGLTVEDLKRDHGAWLDRVQTCGHCGERRRCSQVLEQADAASPAQAGFCPNAADYAALSEGRS